MNFRTVFSPAYLLGMAMLLARQTMAFELRHVGFSNTTKNRLMTPLNLDNRLLSSRRAGSKTDMVLSSPRGIVLNTAVGGLTFAGGLMGFVKGSKASLIAGSTFGGLLLLSALIISKSSESKTSTGNILGFSVSGMLGFVMGKKFLVSKKFMPAGLLASLSAIAFVYNIIETKILSASKSTSEDKSDSSSSSIDTNESGDTCTE